MHRRIFLSHSALLLAQTHPPAEAVKEMVGVSHRDPKRVRELLDLHPGLVSAAIDWAFGDWESALDAASHVGNREIAEFLLSRGARPTIFSAAMLGQLDVVKAFIAAQPGIQKTYGPHGITLFAHAKSEAVKEYLKSLGDADIRLPIEPLSTGESASIVGRYTHANGHFDIDFQNGRLGINSPGQNARALFHHAGNTTFYPSGAPWAKFHVTKDGMLFYKNGNLSVTAKKV
jgi:hypothetical protein